MTTRFHYVSWGLQYTDVFLHIDTIKKYIQSFQNGREVDDTTKMSEEIALLGQDRMQEEINQHIRISDKLAKEELFDYLIGWINYFEYNLKKTEGIKNAIEKYNETRLKEYAEIIQAEENKFKQTNQYKTLKHLDFHEVESNLGVLMGYIQKAFYNQKRLEQYRKFFEAPDPDLIDIDFLPQYLELINPIISRCVNIAKKRLSYLKGDNEHKQLPSPDTKTIEAPILRTNSKVINTNMTVEQLTMLFRLLKECKLISVKARHEKDIHAFISEHFETTGLEGKKSSPKNIGRLWSSTDPAVLIFWIAKFKELSEKAERK